MAWGSIRKDIRYAAENDNQSNEAAVERNLNRIKNASKTLYKRNVLGILFRPESQKSEISTVGSKK